MTDDERRQIWHMLCPDPLWQRKREKKREKERKREKKSERADRAKISSFVFFFVSVVLSRPSLLSTLSLTLYSKNRHCRGREEEEVNKTLVDVSFSSCSIHDSNAKNRFRMAPRRLDRRSERIFHFQRTVERISRRARKEEY